MNEKEEKVIETINVFQTPSSLNKKVEEGEEEFGDFIEDTSNNIEETVLNEIEKEELQKLLKETLTEREIDIIEKRYFEGKTVEEIHLEMNIDKKEINTIFQKFSNGMVLFEVPLIENIEFIKKEMNKKPIDSILTEKEKEYLSMLYGIQNRWNNEGKKYTTKELTQIFDTTKYIVFHKKKEAIRKLRLAQVGKLFPEFGIIPSHHLEELLNDPHIPLKKDDVELLKNILKIGLEEESIVETLQNQKKITINVKSIKRKYQRAILLLKKYENGEIEPQLSFEKEIKPNLKYFSGYEQKLLTLIYKEEKSASQIKSVFKKSIDKIRWDINKVKITLYAILQKENIVNLFSFEEARKIIEKEDFYLGDNHELFIQIYQLYYGENGNESHTVPQIKEKLNLPYSQQQIYKFLTDTILTIQKYKYGFFIKPIIEKEDIKNYYEKKQANLSKTKLKSLSYYLKKSSLLNDSIATDLQIDILKEADKLSFSFTKTTKKEILELLRNPLLEISEETRNILYAYYEIKGREIMTIEEKQKLTKILTPFYKKEKKIQV